MPWAPPVMMALETLYSDMVDPCQFDGLGGAADRDGRGPWWC
jgi:hypothetical protein